MPAQPGHQIGLGIVYSMNDSVIYTIQSFGGSIDKLYKYDATNLSAPAVLMQDPVESLYLEVGPDHNVYLAQTGWNAGRGATRCIGKLLHLLLCTDQRQSQRK